MTISSLPGIASHIQARLGRRRSDPLYNLETAVEILKYAVEDLKKDLKEIERRIKLGSNG